MRDLGDAWPSCDGAMTGFRHTRLTFRAVRVLLVHPEFPITYWGFQNSLPFIGKRATLPPLGLLTLGALLPPTWQARLSDLNVAPLRDDDMLWADAVLVGGMLVQSPSALEVVRRAHALGRKLLRALPPGDRTRGPSGGRRPVPA